MIRPATLSDMNAIIGIAMAHSVMYPELRACKPKIRQVVSAAISSAAHFCFVSTKDGKVDGAIIGLVSENMWAERKNCSVALWVSQSEGIRLLQAFREWVKSRRAIRVAGFSVDTDNVDPRVWKLAEMMGFKRHGGAYLLYN